MQRHIRLYNQHFSIYSPYQWIKSELSDRQGQDYHHIIGRMKSRPELDRVENVMLINHEHEHVPIHTGKLNLSRKELFEIHEQNLINWGKPYDIEFLNKLKNEAI